MCYSSAEDEEEYERLREKEERLRELLCDCLRFVKTHCAYCGTPVCESCGLSLTGLLFCYQCYEYTLERM